jgi:hypothetical protein
MSVVRLEHLTKVFPGGTTAVEDFTLIADGDAAGPADDVPTTVDDAAASQLWTAKVAQHPDVAIGRAVVLSLNLREASFFDPRTGAAIPVVSAGVAEPAAVAVGS